MKRLQYFGTDTRTPGHYFWHFDEGRMTCEYLRYFKGYTQGNAPLPWNPEDVLKEKSVKGTVEFHQIEGYSILGIVGSPGDSRPGCKMVFFVKAIISRAELVELIQGIPPAQAIISACKFKILL